MIKVIPFEKIEKTTTFNDLRPGTLFCYSSSPTISDKLPSQIYIKINNNYKNNSYVISGEDPRFADFLKENYWYFFEIEIDSVKLKLI